MKKCIRYGWVLLSFFLFSFVSVNDVVNAIKAGSASQLSKFFDNIIEIRLQNKSNAYSKSQAELVVRDFFKLNTVQDFSILLKGSGSDALFVSGALFTSTGVYQTTLFLKQKGDKQLIQELRFEK